MSILQLINKPELADFHADVHNSLFLILIGFSLVHLTPNLFEPHIIFLDSKKERLHLTI